MIIDHILLYINISILCRCFVSHQVIKTHQNRACRLSAEETSISAGVLDRQIALAALQALWLAKLEIWIFKNHPNNKILTFLPGHCRLFTHGCMFELWISEGAVRQHIEPHILASWPGPTIYRHPPAAMVKHWRLAMTGSCCLVGSS